MVMRRNSWTQQELRWRERASGVIVTQCDEDQQWWEVVRNMHIVRAVAVVVGALWWRRLDNTPMPGLGKRTE